MIHHRSILSIEFRKYRRVFILHLLTIFVREKNSNCWVVNEFNDAYERRSHEETEQTAKCCNIIVCVVQFGAHHWNKRFIVERYNQAAEIGTGIIYNQSNYYYIQLDQWVFWITFLSWISFGSCLLTMCESDHNCRLFETLGMSVPHMMVDNCIHLDPLVRTNQSQLFRNTAF